MIRKLVFVAAVLTIVLILSHYQFGLFEPYNWITAKKDISNQQIQFVIYGELDPEEKLRNKAASELGFIFFRPTGCVVDQPFINGVKDYNNVVDNYLNELNPNWEEELKARIQQLKTKVIFNPTQTFEIMNFKQYSDYPSSDPDTSYCTNWKLTDKDINNILVNSKPISGQEWHILFSHLPCVYSGTLTQNDTEFKFEINGGSWLTISADTTTYYGDLDATLSELFLDDAWQEGEGEE